MDCLENSSAQSRAQLISSCDFGFPRMRSFITVPLHGFLGLNRYSWRVHHAPMPSDALCSCFGMLKSCSLNEQDSRILGKKQPPDHISHWVEQAGKCA